jgi:hypothetical protein
MYIDICGAGLASHRHASENRLHKYFAVSTRIIYKRADFCSFFPGDETKWGQLLYIAADQASLAVTKLGQVVQQ